MKSGIQISLFVSLIYILNSHTIPIPYLVYPTAVRALAGNNINVICFIVQIFWFNLCANVYLGFGQFAIELEANSAWPGLVSWHRGSFINLSRVSAIRPTHKARCKRAILIDDRKRETKRMREKERERAEWDR